MRNMLLATMATGAIALMTDPSGHPIGLYSRASLPPAKKAP